MTTPAPYPPVDGTEPCRTGDPGRFFNLPRGAPTTANKRLPSAIEECEGCHVREQCYQYALTHDLWGVWGATTRRQRRAIQKQQGIRPVNLEASVLDPEWVARAHHRGLSLPDIAELAQRDYNTVAMAWRKWRHDHPEEEVAS